MATRKDFSGIFTTRGAEKRVQGLDILPDQACLQRRSLPRHRKHHPSCSVVVQSEQMATIFLFLSYRWTSVCKSHARKKVRYHDWPCSREVWCDNGWVVIHTRPAGRDILVWRHLVSSWCHCECCYWLGSLYLRYCVFVYRHFLYTYWRTLLSGLYWCDSTLLHLYRIGKYSQQFHFFWYSHHSHYDQVLGCLPAVIQKTDSWKGPPLKTCSLCYLW